LTPEFLADPKGDTLTKHIAILGAPFQGHVNVTLAVVAELTRRGHRVTYVTIEKYADAVRAAGGDVLGYPSSWPDGKPVPAETQHITADDMAGDPLSFLLENEAMITAVEPALADDVPDLIVYDTLMYAAGYTLGRKWNRPAAQFVPLFATNRHYSLTAALGELLPAIDMAHPKLAEFAARLVQFRETHGLDGGSTMAFLRHIEELNVVFLPRSFQPAGETFDERFVFVGPSLIDRTTEAPWAPPDNGNPTVFVALGSVFNARPDFYRKCVAAFADLPWNVVISTGPNVHPADLGEIPQHMDVRQWFPSQLAILEHATVFVTHSALGSTMEAMYYGTPVVAVPQYVENDIVSRRTAELGLGIRIPADEMTPERLRDTVLAVADDDAIAARVRDMRKQVIDAGGPIRVADELDAYLARSL
jgi:dTDP-L-oleandrosyltransferase